MYAKEIDFSKMNVEEIFKLVKNLSDLQLGFICCDMLLDYYNLTSHIEDETERKSTREKIFLLGKELSAEYDENVEFDLVTDEHLKRLDFINKLTNKIDCPEDFILISEYEARLYKRYIKQYCLI